MKRTFMIGVAAGALLAGANFASAQNTMERQPSGANIEQKSGGAVKQQQKGSSSIDLKANSPAGKARAQAQDNMKSTTGQAPQNAEKMDTQKQGAQSTSQPAKNGTSVQSDTKAGGSTSAQGNNSAQSTAGAKANLSAEQKTKIRETVIRSSNAPRVTNVNFSLSVGTVVPRTVRFAPLPPVLVEINPAWRGYEFFVVEEQIVIIEPRTLKIVAVLNV
jgi:hypothetical protein